METKIVDFQVWQDFMPRVNAGDPPLHALVAIEIEASNALTPTATVTLSRAAGETIVQAPLSLLDGTPPTEGSAPGTVRLEFNMQSASVPMQLTEGEKIGGTVTLNLGGREVNLPLPEAELMFTH